MAYDVLCRLDEVKAWGGIPPTEESKEEMVEGLIESCSDNIGRYCGRDNLGSVITYLENYFMPIAPTFAKPDYSPSIVLRHYPVVAISSIKWAGQTINVLTAAQLQQSMQQSGAFLKDDLRTLTFFGLWMPPSSGAVQIGYTAGYYLTTPVAGAQKVPAGLRQATVQWVSELYKSTNWIGYKSKSLAGEVVTFEGGNQWGMSPRTKAMLEPHRNRIPIEGYM